MALPSEAGAKLVFFRDMTSRLIIFFAGPLILHRRANIWSVNTQTTHPMLDTETVTERG